MSDSLSRALPTDATSELHVLGIDGDTLAMDSAEVRVLKQVHEIHLRSLLQGQDGVALELELRFEVHSHLPHKALKRQLTDQKLGRLLIPADLTESHRARTKTMRLLDATSVRSGFACSLSSKGFPGRLATRGLARRLLGACHGVRF